MMISRRPVSSPGRVEKYQPPFMGFLRSKSNGSRSQRRGRSRASPLFVRRNKSVAAVTQEPSSPKVTCMGQVRVKRSKAKVVEIKPDSKEDPTRRRCKWIENASFRYKFAGKSKTMSFWPKWGLCSLQCTRRQSKVDSPRSQLDRPETELAGEEVGENFKIPKLDRLVTESFGEEVVEGENYKTPKLIVSPDSTPPINAFLLTRSRSAPYRSSSLAFKFWEENNQREVELRSKREQNVRSENTESENSYENINGNYDSASINETEVELPESGLIRRPGLTRSKSEPARIGEKIPDRKGLGLSRD